MIKKTTHTAPGQMAGYLFQPDRALVLLCKCKNNESVSIELIDDVAIVDENGVVTYREQDKNSIQEDGQPFKNRSKDLWNTLLIWIEETSNGSLNPDLTTLVCVTNKGIDDDSIIKKISIAKTNEEVDKVVSLLKNAAQNPPLGLIASINKVLKEEQILKRIIPRIELVDNHSFKERSDEIANELGLTDDIKEDVLTDLRGWLNSNVLSLLDNGKAPIIKKIHFNQRVQKARENAGNKKITVLAKRFIQLNITNAKIEEAKEKTFVKQLELLEHYDINNIIIDAIDDFFYSEAERTRLTMEGDISASELLAMDDNCKDRWKDIFRNKMRNYNEKMNHIDLSSLAYEIYDSTIQGYLSKLKGNETQPYFTKGSYHKLSDDLEIGWHPNWINILNKDE